MARKKMFTGEDGREYIAKEKKPFYKKWWFIALVVILIVGAFSGGDDEETPDVADGADTTDVVEEVDAREDEDSDVEEPVEEPVEESYTVGDLVNVGDVTYTVNNIDTATNVGGEWGENSKGTFLLVNVTVTNNGDEALTVDDSLFKLLNDGKEYDSDSLAGMYANDDSSFFLESINPELSLTGNVVFDVSDAVVDSPIKQLKVSTGFWGTETEVIDLQ